MQYALRSFDNTISSAQRNVMTFWLEYLRNLVWIAHRCRHLSPCQAYREYQWTVSSPWCQRNKVCNRLCRGSCHHKMFTSDFWKWWSLAFCSNDLCRRGDNSLWSSKAFLCKVREHLQRRQSSLAMECFSCKLNQTSLVSGCLKLWFMKLIFTLIVKWRSL